MPLLFVLIHPHWIIWFFFSLMKHLCSSHLAPQGVSSTSKGLWEVHLQDGSSVCRSFAFNYAGSSTEVQSPNRLCLPKSSPPFLLRVQALKSPSPFINTEVMQPLCNTTRVTGLDTNSVFSSFSVDTHLPESLSKRHLLYLALEKAGYFLESGSHELSVMADCL